MFFVDKEDDVNEEVFDVDGFGLDYIMIGIVIGGYCLCVVLVVVMKIVYRVFFIGLIIMKFLVVIEVFWIGIYFFRLI